MSSLMIKEFSTVRDEQHSAEIESLFQKTEFESKQLLKSIENEKEQIAAIKKQLEMRPKQIKEMEAETRRCEEEVKRLHRQLTHNVAMSESMKKQSVQLDEEIEKLRSKLAGLGKKTVERAVEYNEKLEKYKEIWKSYEQKYASSPKAQEYMVLQQTVEKLALKKSELAQQREKLERKLNEFTTRNTEKSQKPRWTDWFVELASIKTEAIRLQNESAKICQEKSKALEDNKFLKVKLTSLKAEQFAKQSSLQADQVMYEATQEQYEGENQEPSRGDAIDMMPEDTTTTLAVNTAPQNQLSIEQPSSKDSQQLQQMQQFTFTDAPQNQLSIEQPSSKDSQQLQQMQQFTFTDVPQNQLSIEQPSSKDSQQLQQMQQFTFTDAPQDHLSIEQSSSEDNQQLQQMQQFTFTDPSTNNNTAFSAGAGKNNNELMFPQTGFESQSEFDSQGGFNFPGFSENVNAPQQGSSGLQLTTQPNPNPIFGQFSFTSPRVGGSGEEGATGVSCFGSPASSVTSGGQDNFFLFSGTQTPTTNSSNVFNFF